MKFGKEFVAQMVPEWQEAYMDYNRLKIVLKGIHKFKKQTNPSPSSSSTGGGLKRRMTMYRAFSGLTRQLSNLACQNHHQGDAEDQVILVSPVQKEGSEHEYRSMFLMSSDQGGEYELVFFKRLDDQLNKVNSFYKAKVEQVLNEAAALSKQMDALIAFRIKVDKAEDSIGALFPSAVNATTGTVMPGISGVLPFPPT